MLGSLADAEHLSDSMDGGSHEELELVFVLGLSGSAPSGGFLLARSLKHQHVSGDRGMANGSQEQCSDPPWPFRLSSVSQLQAQAAAGVHKELPLWWLSAQCRQIGCGLAEFQVDAGLWGVEGGGRLRAGLPPLTRLSLLAEPLHSPLDSSRARITGWWAGCQRDPRRIVSQPPLPPPHILQGFMQSEAGGGVSSRGSS